jgi:hypothetical protein
MNNEMLVAIDDDMLEGVSGGHDKAPVDSKKPKEKDPVKTPRRKKVSLRKILVLRPRHSICCC